MAHNERGDTLTLKRQQERMCVCVYVCMCGCVYVCMCVCADVCMCVCVYVRMQSVPVLLGH